MQKKSFLIIEKIKKYLKCPALRRSAYFAVQSWPIMGQLTIPRWSFLLMVSPTDVHTFHFCNNDQVNDLSTEIEFPFQHILSLLRHRENDQCNGQKRLGTLSFDHEEKQKKSASNNKKIFSPFYIISCSPVLYQHSSLSALILRRKVLKLQRISLFAHQPPKRREQFR